MRRRLARLPAILAGFLTLGACTYDPPVQADHASAKYRTELKQCRDTVDPKVELQGRSTFPGFLISPFTNPPRERAGIRACMVGKGYALRSE